MAGKKLVIAKIAFLSVCVTVRGTVYSVHTGDFCTSTYIHNIGIAR
jgi:hypothetical protein